MQNYAPRYWLINGQAYPDTAEIDTIAGNTVLLRYVNATHATARAWDCSACANGSSAPTAGPWA